MTHIPLMMILHLKDLEGGTSTSLAEKSKKLQESYPKWD